jgi:hypothetical protein
LLEAQGSERHSVYCFATDITDEGAGAVLDNIVERAGISSVTVAAKYHAVSDVYPHNPLRKVATLPPGVFYRPRPAPGPEVGLRPQRSAAARERDVLEETCSAAEPRGMDVEAWLVVCHHDEAAPGTPGLQVNCFGDEIAGSLCPASTPVRDFAEQIVDEVASYPVRALRLESLHFQGAGHGHHHERLLETYGESGLFLLGMCFCSYCTQRVEAQGIDATKLRASVRSCLEGLFDGEAVSAPLSLEGLTALCGQEVLGYLGTRSQAVSSLAARLAEVAGQHGTEVCLIDEAIAAQSYATALLSGPIKELGRAALEFATDLAALGASGASIEVTGYLRDAAQLEAALRWYREHVPGQLAVILRPGPPDSLDAGDLAAKVEVARNAGASEVNFYAYGLYRLAALERIRASMEPAR